MFKTKLNVNGSLKKLKLGKMFSTNFKVYYIETFSPIVKLIIIGVVLALAIFYNWHINQVDANNAFPNGESNVDVYMAQL